MISTHRKKELLKHCQFIMTDLPTSIKGNKSMAQEVINRIEKVVKSVEEFDYLKDAITLLIEQSKGKEVQVIYRGQELTKERMFKEFGVFPQFNKKMKKS